MKALRNLLIFLLIVAGLLAAISQRLPNHYSFKRDVIIDATREEIYPWINNLQKWPEWTVWTAAQDPTLTYTYEGPESGVGAVSEWESKKLGNGRMEIVESSVMDGLSCDLSFEQGKFQCTSGIKFLPAGFSTKLVWSLECDISRNPVHRWFGLFLEKETTPAMEQGLKNLKKLVETEKAKSKPAPPPSAVPPLVVTNAVAP